MLGIILNISFLISVSVSDSISRISRITSSADSQSQIRTFGLDANSGHDSNPSLEIMLGTPRTKSSNTFIPIHRLNLGSSRHGRSPTESGKQDSPGSIGRRNTDLFELAYENPSIPA